MMKRISIALLLVVFFIGSLCAQTVYQVETASGTKDVVIPDGMTELDVLLYLAGQYYDLSDSYDILEARAETLSDAVKDYVAANRGLRVQYNQLLSDYQDLDSTYRKLLSIGNYKAVLGLGARFSGDLTMDGVDVRIGVLLMQKVGLTTSLGMSLAKPYRFVYGLGVSVIL